MTRKLSSRPSRTLLIAFALLLTCGIASAAPTRTGSSNLSAHLTKMSFKQAEVKKVKLVYSFSATSKSFGYLLSFKQGSKWLKVNSVKETGTFKGLHEMTVKKLFAGKPVKIGDYRLKLFTDGESKLLGFTVNGGKVGATIVAISAGGDNGEHTCALYSDHTVECWGENWKGQLGNGTKTDGVSPVQVKGVGGRGMLSNVTQVSAGGGHTCALSSSGTVTCWGYNGGGQLGDDNEDHRSTSWEGDDISPTPVQVKGVGGTGILSNVTQISASGHHTCVLLADRTVECWGLNYSGQLGNGTTTHSLTPVQVKDAAGTGTLSNVTQIDAGDAYTCALLVDHTVECWGRNGYGQLGNGTTTNSTTPVQVEDAAGTGTLSNVTQISVGFEHACALLADHTVECWGSDYAGQLGDGSTYSQSATPVQVKGVGGTGALSNVTQISAGGVGIGVGGSHTCAVQADHAVECWGYNDSGELGNGTGRTSSIPVRVEGVGGRGMLSNVSQVSAGSEHTCALQANHAVSCWGHESGASGSIGHRESYDSATPFPLKYLAGHEASAIRISAHLTKKSFTEADVEKVKLVYRFSATSESFGFLLSFKKGSKWLKISHSEKTGIFIGSREITAKELFVYEPVKAGEYRLKLFAERGRKLLSFTIKSTPVNTVLPAISGATRQGQALTASKGSWKYSPTSYAYRWRRCNSAGASCSNISGASANSYRLTAKDVVGSTIAVVVTATNSHGSTNAVSAPMAVGATVLAISAGSEHTCALSSGGTAKCWGDNYYGQLGNGTSTDSATPVQVKGVGSTGILSNVTQIGVGGSYTCVLLTDGTVKCWGYGGGGGLGNGTMTGSATPVQVKGVGGAGTLVDVTQISAGGGHTCALLAGGTVVCWGGNGSGELGDGTASLSSTPVQVKDAAGTGTLSNVTQISAGGSHTCALLSDHTVECWGSNRDGQLGDGSRYSQSVTPVQVKGVGGRGALVNVTQVSAGGGHTCALLAGGTVVCWGWNAFGQLGDSTMSFSSTPVQVKDAAGTGTLSNVTQISTGGSYACALLADHTIECWGSGDSGQLGNGKRTKSSKPVQVKGVGGAGTLSNVIQISAGGGHTCALLNDNTLVCWGSDESGELGNGARIGSTTAVRVKGVGGVGTF